MKQPADHRTPDMFSGVLGPTCQPKARKPRTVRHIRPAALTLYEQRLEACTTRLREHHFAVRVDGDRITVSKWARSLEFIDNLVELERFTDSATGSNFSKGIEDDDA